MCYTDRRYILYAYFTSHFCDVTRIEYFVIKTLPEDQLQPRMRDPLR